MSNTLFNTMTQDVAFDGQAAKLVKLHNKNGLSVIFMDIGATWLSCRVPVADQQREVLLGVSSMADFKKQSTYLGATVGRFANRIANGQFNIDGHPYQLTTNQAGNTLHGGVDGFDKRRWKISEQSQDKVRFTLLSENADQGFPGQLKVSVCYQLTDDNEIIIRYQANTDKATPVNLTNHAYFNLAGAESGSDCRKHSLYINAEQYLPTNEVGIPLNGLASVAQTSFDFRQPKVISSDFLSDPQQQLAKGYDHAFLLNNERQQGTPAALLSNADKSLSLAVYTDKPGIQLYTGNWLAGTPNRSAGEYQDYAGIALETEFLPDAVNHPEWQPSPILRPGQTYHYQTTYHFIVNHLNQQSDI